MPLAAREQLELGFTIAVTLFVVAALATLRPERADAFLIAGVFLVQIIYPAPFVRFAAAFVLLVFAIDLLCARRRTSVRCSGRHGADDRPRVEASTAQASQSGPGTLGLTPLTVLVEVDRASQVVEVETTRAIATKAVPANMGRTIIWAPAATRSSSSEMRRRPLYVVLTGTSPAHTGPPTGSVSATTVPTGPVVQASARDPATARPPAAPSSRGSRSSWEAVQQHCHVVAELRGCSTRELVQRHPHGRQTDRGECQAALPEVVRPPGPAGDRRCHPHDQPLAPCSPM